MQVKVFDYSSAGDPSLRGECNLHDCFPADSRGADGESEFLAALNELQRTGRYWAGGGAQPLTLLMVVRS